MTSVNELNGYQRGLEEGRRQGEAISNTKCKKVATAMRWADIITAFSLGVIFTAIMLTTSDACAQTATTSLTVTASVPCNPVNCPVIPKWYSVSEMLGV